MADISSAYIPQIIEFTPTEFTSSVPVRPEISVRFTLDMHVGTLSDVDAAAYINEHAVLANRATDTPCPLAFVSYDAREKLLKFEPSANLDAGSTYTVTILAGFASATGRGTTADVTWTFKVSSTAVPKATLSLPADASELGSMPILDWADIAVTDVTYQLQVADNLQFSNTIYGISGLSSSSFDALSSIVILPATTYYWRVRGVAGSVIGEWSDAASFRVKTSGSSATIFDTFGLISSYPPAGASNLQAWPEIRLVFNLPVDENSVSNLQIAVEHVDTGAAGDAPTMTTSVSGPLVIVTLSDVEIADNTKYTLVVSGVQSESGATLSEAASVSFTGPYTPLYTTAGIIRGTYGRFLSRYTDEEVNFQVHRSSIKCNRYILDAGSSPIADLLVAQTLTFDMEAYVEAHAAYSLIQSYLYEILEQAGRRTQLDTLAGSVESRLIPDIDGLLKKLEKEVKRLEIILRGAPAPKSGVRSEQWDPSSLYNDTSIGNLGRGKF